MKDRILAWLSIAFFVAALILPLLSLGAGLVAWDWETASLKWSEHYNLWVGVGAAIVAFALCFTFGIVLALRVDRPVWPEIVLPFLSGIGYSVLNIIPLPIDDVVVTIGGALVSYGMAAKRYQGLSKWALAPTVTAAIYTIVGEFVPGPVDELAVGAVAAVASSIIAGVSSKRAENKIGEQAMAPESLEAKAPETDE
jgi:hypothetical protein